MLLAILTFGALSACGGTTVAVDATVTTGRVLPNPVSTLTIWNGFEKAKYPEFLEYALLFTATGGNAERDLFAAPADESRTDDYDFTRLLKMCRDVRASGLTPYLHLGNVPAKLTKGCDPRRAKQGGRDGGSYGFNIRPPDDFAAYAAYMRALAEALAREFGRGEVRRWRFSVLTEANNRNWFEAKDGTNASTKEAFFRLYDHTVKAFTDVLGDDILIGTHLLGLDSEAKMTTFAYSDVIAHCRDGANSATGGTGAPLNLLAFSYYFDHPGDDKANPTAGRMTDFLTLRKALDAAGFRKTAVCMDEGRVYQSRVGGEGRKKTQLLSRAVGQSWQAAFDVRAAKSVFEGAGDNFASWGHLAGPNGRYEGLPTVSWFVARELAKFRGLRLLKPSVRTANLAAQEQVDAIAAVADDGRTVRLALSRFRDRLDFGDRTEATVTVTLPAALRGRTVVRSALAVDDANNWFVDWLADRSADGIGVASYLCGLDDQAALAVLTDESARASFARFAPKYAQKAAKVVPVAEKLAVPADGVVSFPVAFVGNAAVFVAFEAEGDPLPRSLLSAAVPCRAMNVRTEGGLRFMPELMRYE